MSHFDDEEMFGLREPGQVAQIAHIVSESDDDYDDDPEEGENRQPAAVEGDGGDPSKLCAELVMHN